VAYRGAANSTLIDGLNVDGSATWIGGYPPDGCRFADATAHRNSGTATLDGASPSAATVVYRGIKAQQRPKLTLISKGGSGTGLYPTVTVTANTGFVLGSVNGDTSVWGWEV
jgi:hypothetical protein